MLPQGGGVALALWTKSCVSLTKCPLRATMSRPTAAEVFRRIDYNKDGSISEEEFRAAMSGKKTARKTRLREMLRAKGESWRDTFSRCAAW